MESAMLNHEDIGICRIDPVRTFPVRLKVIHNVHHSLNFFFTYVSDTLLGLGKLQ